MYHLSAQGAVERMINVHYYYYYYYYIALLASGVSYSSKNVPVEDRILCLCLAVPGQM